MNSSKTKSRMMMAGAIVASLAVATGCCTRSKSAQSQAPAPISYNENVGPYVAPAAGGTGPSYGTETGGTMENANNVEIPLQKEQMAVGTQQVSNGAVRITKSVKTQTVVEPVQIRQETVTVDRVPAGSAPQAQAGTPNTALNTPFQGGEITIPLNKEQPVVTTQIVPAGSVVVRKSETPQTVNVQGQVRSEDVTATPVGNPQNVNISSNLESTSQQAAAPSGEATGAASAPSGQAGGAGVSSEPITQMSQLSGDPSTLSGRTVNLSNAKVQRVVSDQLIVLQGDNGSPLYVRLAQPTPGLQSGQTVSLHGTVQSVPSDTSSLGWDPASTQAVQGQQIIIIAPSVTTSP